MSEHSFLPFYEKYYAAIAASQTNAEYCQRLFGRNMGQQGFAEIGHLEHLMAVCGIGPTSRVLDLGCGNGMEAEFISECTGAHVTGIDFVPFAIQQALDRTQARQDRLQFQVMDIGKLDFPAASFDVLVSVDTLYFSDLEETLKRMQGVLKPGGRMGIFYNYSWEPWTPIENFNKDAATHPDRTDLALLIKQMGLDYRCWDYTARDIEHAKRKEQLAEELRPRFQAEGSLFLYNDHIGERPAASSRLLPPAPMAVISI